MKNDTYHAVADWTGGQPKVPETRCMLGVLV